MSLDAGTPSPEASSESQPITYHFARKHLPYRRDGDAYSFEHKNIPYRVMLGRYENGRIGEVFLDGGKNGSELQAMARDFAVVTSIALQYGAPLEVIRKAVTRLDDNSAAGPGGAMLDILGDGHDAAR